MNKYIIILAVLFTACNTSSDIEYSVSDYQDLQATSDQDSFDIIQPIIEETGISLLDFQRMDTPWYEDVIDFDKVNELSNGISSKMLAVVDNGPEDHDPECISCTELAKNATGEDLPGDHQLHVRGITGGVNIGLERGQHLVGEYKALLASGRGSSTDILQACQWAIADGYKTISMSLGGSRPFPSLELLIKNNPQVLFVCAAGNSSHSTDQNTTGWPANYAETYDNVISVGSIDGRSGKLLPSGFTSRGVVTISAPGHSICSSITDNKYAVYSGTSMATPYVSSLAAQFWSIYPDATPTIIKSLIEETAIPLEHEEDVVGKGLLDFTKMLERAHELQGGVVPPPPPQPDLCLELEFEPWRIESIGMSRKTIDFEEGVSVRDQKREINDIVYQMDRDWRNKYRYAKAVPRPNAPTEEVESVRSLPVWIVRDQRGEVCHTQILMQHELAGKK